MILILGGAYQGKRRYVKEAFSLSDLDFHVCGSTEIDFTKRCICNLEEYTYACIQDGIDPMTHLAENRAAWENTIFICQDIFCGVVPLERTLRLWRDATGKVCQYLSQEAEQVSRIYCGLEQRLK